MVMALIQTQNWISCACRLVALLSLLCLPVACSAKKGFELDEPQAFVKAYLQTLDAQDNDDAWAFLSSRSKNSLEKLALDYNQTHDGVNRAPAHMLRFGHVIASTREYKKILCSNQNESSAVVDVVLQNGNTLQIQLVKENSQWAVDLPIHTTNTHIPSEQVENHD